MRSSCQRSGKLGLSSPASAKVQSGDGDATACGGQANLAVGAVGVEGWRTVKGRPTNESGCCSKEWRGLARERCLSPVLPHQQLLEKLVRVFQHLDSVTI